MADRRAGLPRLPAKVLQAIVVALLGVLMAPQTAAGERAIKARVAPVYPEIAKRLHIEGVVKIEATVDGEGKVVDVKTLSGNRMLAIAAEEAVRRWKFATGSREEKVNVDVNFALNR